MAASEIKSDDAWKYVNDFIAKMEPLPNAEELTALGDNPGKCRAGNLSPESGKVCVTGASGFIAMHLVSQLLSKGYDVVATIRSASKASQFDDLKSTYGNKLILVDGCDLMVPSSFDKAVEGCVGVFHTASPFYKASDKGSGVDVAGWSELVIPAYVGTKSVLESCQKAGTVKRVVVTASYACMINVDNPDFPGDYHYTDKTWNVSSFPDPQTKCWGSGAGMHAYRYSKIMAERTAWTIATHSDFDVVCINPPLVIGDNLTPVSSPEDLNESSKIIYNFLMNKDIVLGTNSMGFVDVADVAKAHIVTYENEQAGGNRYLTTAPAMLWADVAALLKSLCPNNPNTAQAAPEDPKLLRTLNTSRLQSLGMTFISGEDAIRAQVESLLKQFPEIATGSL